MINEYAEARKRYVQEVRNSFSAEDTGRAAVHARLHAGVIEEHADSLKETGTKGLVYVRLLLAGMLFAAFLFCDRTDTKLFSMTTDQLAEKISENQKLPTKVSSVIEEAMSYCTENLNKGT